MPQDPAELERKLDNGEWLRPSQVAALFDTSRQSVDRWIRSGRIGYRRRGPAGHRVLNPGDVRRELEDYRRERWGAESGEEPGDGPAPPTG